MIRKNAPFLLIVLAGMLVLTMVMLNMTQYLRNPGGLQEIRAPNADAIAQMRDRQQQAVGPDGATVKQLSEAAFPGKGAPGDFSAAGIPETPTIRIPNSRYYEPTFDSATTSSQWYDDDSYQKVNAKQNEGKRVEPD